MGTDPAAVLIDARGMRCPWPALRLARAMAAGARAGAGMIVVDLLADDPAAPAEIAALAAERGWKAAPLVGRHGFRVISAPA